MENKKILILLFHLMLLCFLCSCSNGEEKAVGNHMAAFNCEFAYFNYAISGEQGYYFLCDGLIGYWDGNMEHKAVPLCKRPDCSHHTDECPAFISGAYKKIFYKEGNLYLFSSFGHQNPVTKAENTPLWKVAADGSSKEIALYAEELPQLYTIARNKVYYESHTENKNGKYVCRIHCKPLKGGEEVLVWESGLQNSFLEVLQEIEGKIYFSETGIDMSVNVKEPGFDFKNAETERNFYSYQPETGELLVNPEFDGKDGRKVFIRNIFDGKIYYSYGEEREKEFWCRPLGKEGAGTLIGIQPYGVNKADSDFMYSLWMMDVKQETNGMKAYDHEGNLLQEFQLPHMGDSIEWIPATEEYIFGHYIGVSGENGRSEAAIILIERDKLAEGKAEMIRIFENK